ncbi:MFS transporter [Clostridium sp.]|uniref:MFS transporter n=1 Tax=Clostridium sp. TaxID=1506 RepID=UPI003F3217A9
MTNSKQNLSRNILIIQLLCSESLIVPIKILFLISFMLTNSDLSVLKFILVTSVFLLEVPSGYLSDKYGNKKVVIISKISMIIAMIGFCVSKNIYGFIFTNILVGLSTSMESGSQNTYFLDVCYQNDIDYTTIKIQIQKYKNIFNFILMLVSSLIFSLWKYTPYILTALFYLISLILLVLLPTESLKSTTSSKSIFISSKYLFFKIIKNRMLFIELIFYTVCTSIIISNFDYYTVFFNNLGVKDELYGIIYSSFMIISIIGVQIYSNKLDGKKEYWFFLLVPISFLLIRLENYISLSVGIFIQQLTYSYFMIHFDIYVLKSIDNLDESSQYQSMISFINTLIRMTILFILSIMFKFINLNSMYIFFSITMFITVYLYFNFRKTIAVTTSKEL